MDSHNIQFGPWGGTARPEQHPLFTATSLGEAEPPTSPCSSCGSCGALQGMDELKPGQHNASYHTVRTENPVPYERFCNRDRTVVPSPYQERIDLCSKTLLHAGLQGIEHYLILMTRGLGSIITIHKTFPHLATDREQLHMELQRRPFFSKAILKIKQKLVIGGLKYLSWRLLPFKD